MKKKKFVEYLTDSNYLPYADIISALDTETFPMSDNSFYSHDPRHLAAEEFNRCVQEYKDKANGSKSEDLQHVMALMVFYETDHREFLENATKEIIKDMYDIPDYITLQSKIKWISEVEENDSSILSPEFKLDEKNSRKLRYEIEKRRIINSIIHGGAIHQWSSAFYLLADKFDGLNPELLQLYNQYSALINYFNWMHPLSTSNIPSNQYKSPVITTNSINMFVIQGTSKVDYKKKKLEAEAMCFPVLIHELSKACLEYLMAKGLPNHLSKDEMQYVLDKADSFKEEFWHYYMGPTLWRAILKTANVESQLLPPILSAMSQMDYEELSMFCIKITYDADDTGAKAMNQLKRSLKIK